MKAGRLGCRRPALALFAAAKREIARESAYKEQDDPKQNHDSADNKACHTLFPKIGQNMVFRFAGNKQRLFAEGRRAYIKLLRRTVKLSQKKKGLSGQLDAFLGLKSQQIGRFVFLFHPIHKPAPVVAEPEGTFGFEAVVRGSKFHIAFQTFCVDVYFKSALVRHIDRLLALRYNNDKRNKPLFSRCLSIYLIPFPS